MKRSVNLNGFQKKHRRISASDLVVTLRALGMTDEEIRVELEKLANKKPEKPNAPLPQHE